MILKRNNIEEMYGIDGESYDIFVENKKVGEIGLFFKDGKVFSDIKVYEGHRRRGYAKEAKKLLFSSKSFSEIYSWVNKNNLASIKLQSIMGCRKVDETDDKYLFVWRKND